MALLLGRAHALPEELPRGGSGSNSAAGSITPRAAAGGAARQPKLWLRCWRLRHGRSRAQLTELPYMAPAAGRIGTRRELLLQHGSRKRGRTGLSRRPEPAAERLTPSEPSPAAPKRVKGVTLFRDPLK